MKTRLINHINSITSVTLRVCCREILNCEEFFTWPASLSYHHAYEGGLLAHTLEVCDIAMSSHDRLRDGPVKRDILIAAALWHDFCKVKDYVCLSGRSPHASIDEESPPDVWHGTDYAKRVHHIPGSAIEFTVAARNSGVPEDVIEAVQHCILAHHGRREWGSSVEPQTLEALLLHQSDMISAHYGATKGGLL